MSGLSKDDIVRAEILKAAERVFQKYGLIKTTMEDIAREAGKGKSTLYYYYQSKEEIFNTVVNNEVEFIIKKAREATNSASTAKQKLKTYIVTALSELKNYGSAFAIVKAELKRDQNFIQKKRMQFDKMEETFIRELMKLGVKNGEFHFANNAEFNLAVKTIVGMLHALEFYLLLENDDEAQISMAAKLISEGI